MTVNPKIAVILSAQTAQLVSGVKAANASLNSLASTSKTVGNALNALGIGFGAYQIIQGARQVIGVMAEFEQTMSTLQAVTQDSGEGFKRLRDDAIALAGVTKFTSNEIGQLQVVFARLGFTTDEIHNATEATLMLAQATGEDLAKSAETAGSTVRAFGLQASETARVGDIMASALNKSALELSDFSESMKYVAPIARAAGVSVEETSALLSVLANNGIKGSIAGTSLRKILTEIARDGRPAQDRLNELAKKGITLKDSFDEVGRTAQTSLLVITKNKQEVDNLTGAYRNANGELKKMSDIMMDNLIGDTNKLTASWQRLIITITESEPFRNVVQNLTGILNWINGVDDGSKLIDRLASDFKAFGDVSEPVLRSSVESLKEIRREAGKPFDLTFVDKLAEKYGLTSAQAYKLTKVLKEANTALSFKEVETEKFKQFATGYKDISKAAEEYIKNLDEQIVKLTNTQQLEKQWAIENENASDRTKKSHEGVLKLANEEIASRLRARDIVNEYTKSVIAATTSIAEEVQQVETLEDRLKRLGMSMKLIVDYNSQLTSDLGRSLDKAPTTFAQSSNLNNTSIDNTGFNGLVTSSTQLTTALGTFLKNIEPATNASKEFQNALMDVELQSGATQVATIALGAETENTTRRMSTAIGNLMPLIVDFGSNLAFGLGEAITSTQSFGKTFLKAIANFMGQLGRLMIIAGIGKEKFEKLLSVPGGGPLIVAAGIALTVAAGAVSGALNRGIYGSGTGGRGGAPVNDFSRSTTVLLDGQFRIEGRDLVYIVNKNNGLDAQRKG